MGHWLAGCSHGHPNDDRIRKGEEVAEGDKYPEDDIVSDEYALVEEEDRDLGRSTGSRVEEGIGKQDLRRSRQKY